MSYIICIKLPPDLCADRSDLPEGVRHRGSIPRQAFERIEAGARVPDRGKSVSLPDLGLVLDVAWVSWGYRNIDGHHTSVQIVELDPAPKGKLIKFVASKFEQAGFELTAN